MANSARARSLATSGQVETAQPIDPCLATRCTCGQLLDIPQVGRHNGVRQPEAAFEGRLELVKSRRSEVTEQPQALHLTVPRAHWNDRHDGSAARRREFD